MAAVRLMVAGLVVVTLKDYGRNGGNGKYAKVILASLAQVF